MKYKPSLRESVRLLTALAFLVAAQPFAYPQDAEAHPSAENAIGQYNIDIKENKLLLASLNDAAKLHEIIGSGSATAVTATIENLGKYLRAASTNLNLVVSQEAADVTIQNLKLRSANIAEVMQAISFATEGRVRGTSFSSSGNGWALMGRPQPAPDKTVEVFNLNGFISHLKQEGKKAEGLDEALAEIKKIILDTMIQLKQGQWRDEDNPNFSFHSGTGLFILIGTPTAAEVTRKIVNALPGQQQPGSSQMVDIQIPKKEN